MSSQPLPSATPGVDNTMGALLIGAFASCLLLGIIISQVYFYLGLLPKDNKFIKTFVIYILAVGVLQTCFQCHALYFYLVCAMKFSYPTVGVDGIWSLIAMPLLEAMIGGPVEGFFAFHVWKLSEGSFIGTAVSVIISLLSILRSCLGIAITSMAMQHRDLAWWPHIHTEITVEFVVAAATDVLIAACMIYLWQTQRTRLVPSRSLINNLIMYFVGTGLLTSIWSIVVLVLFFTTHGNLVVDGVRSILPKLYAISMMAILNSREGLSRGQSPDHLTLHPPTHMRHPTEVTITTERVNSHYIPTSRLPHYRSSSYVVPFDAFEQSELEKKGALDSV